MQLNQAIHFIKPNLLVIACSWLACLLINATPVSAQQYPGVKCIVDGNLQCKVQHSIKFGQGDVFFGNQANADLFQANVLDKLKLGQQPKQALVLKANHQLALTNQVKQQHCPITGKSIEEKQQLMIAGVKVFFHDSASKEKMQAAESTWHRAHQVFATAAFAKNFIVLAKPPEAATATVADGSSKLPTNNDGQADSPTTR